MVGMHGCEEKTEGRRKEEERGGVSDAFLLAGKEELVVFEKRWVWARYSGDNGCSLGHGQEEDGARERMMYDKWGWPLTRANEEEREREHRV